MVVEDSTSSGRGKAANFSAVLLAEVVEHVVAGN